MAEPKEERQGDAGTNSGPYYSIGYRDGHPFVRIATAQYRELVEAFLASALTSSAETLAARFATLPFEPYGPVKVQLRRLLLSVNEIRRTAGLPRVDQSVLRTERRAMRPFARPEFAPPGVATQTGWEWG